MKLSGVGVVDDHPLRAGAVFVSQIVGVLVVRADVIRGIQVDRGEGDPVHRHSLPLENTVKPSLGDAPGCHPVEKVDAIPPQIKNTGGARRHAVWGRRPDGGIRRLRHKIGGCVLGGRVGTDDPVDTLLGDTVDRTAQKHRPLNLVGLIGDYDVVEYRPRAREGSTGIPQRLRRFFLSGIDRSGRYGGDHSGGIVHPPHPQPVVPDPPESESEWRQVVLLYQLQSQRYICRLVDVGGGGIVGDSGDEKIISTTRCGAPEFSLQALAGRNPASRWISGWNERDVVHFDGLALYPHFPGFAFQCPICVRWT